MKRWLPFLVSTLCASVALADPPAATAGDTQKAAAALVQKQLLTPLKKRESKRARFSRAAPVPVQRRVRVVDPVAQTDASGKHFVRFAVDARREWDDEGTWQKDALLGCAYLREEQVFVQRGEHFVTADTVLGKSESTRDDVCKAAPEPGAQLASARK